MLSSGIWETNMPVLKELSVLKEHFEITKSMMLGYNKVSSIEMLHEPRCSEMLFLQAVLNKIEEQINKVRTQFLSEAKFEETAQHMEDLICVVYGAMLVARHDTGDSKGKLSKRLTDAIDDGVKSKNKPTPYDYVTFHRALNIFLQIQLFKDNDSRKGFKEGHLLAGIKQVHLKQLLEVSYNLEKAAQIEVIRSLPSDGKKSIDVKDYVVKKATPASALVKFQSWGQLKLDLRKIIIDEFTKKNIATIDELALTRSAQLHFMKKIEALLDESTIPLSEREAVLGGIMHHVEKQILLSYKFRMVYRIVTTSKNSVVSTSLSEFLGITKASPQDIEALYQAANQFVRSMTLIINPVEKQKNDIKKAISSTNPFAEIIGLDLKEILILFQEEICEYRIQALVNNFKVLTPDEKLVKPWIPNILLTSSLPKFGVFKGKSSEEYEQRIAAENPVVN